MKNLVYILLLLPCSNIMSQGLMIGSGGVINVSSTAHIIIAGNGNLSNNGTLTLNNGSWVRFRGTTQKIEGSNSIDFDNIEANATAVNLSRNINVRTSLLMSSGYFDLKEATATLSSSASINGGETNTKRIRATNGSTAEGQGNGKIQITVNNPSGNVANLGVDFSPAGNLGNTTIIRGHKELQGDGAFTGNYSVYRYYDIQPTNQANITVSRFYYFAGELGSQSSNAANLQLFQMINVGVGSDYWHPQNTTVSANYVSSQTNVNSIASYLITLGSISAPLPVELVSFTAQCSKNSVDVKWKTASETNADYFILERSLDGTNFETIAQITAQGNSNNLTNYFKTDALASSLSYYRLSQYDFDGNNYTYQPITVKCSNEEEENITPIYSNEGDVFFEITGKNNQSYSLTIRNSIGQLIAAKSVLANTSRERFAFENLVLAKGMYFVTLSSSENRISKPFVIHE